MDSTILVAAVTGAVSSVATVVTLKNDIKWISKIVEQLDKRVSAIEKERV